MDVHLLGPVQASRDGSPLPLGAPKPRAVLAMLALRAGDAVAAERLVDGLWGDAPPASSAKLVQLYVSQLRRALGPDARRIVTRGRGYELDLAPDAVDALRFEALVRHGDPRGALALWRGAALADLADEPFAATEIGRLEELRLQATEMAIDADLQAGRHQQAVAELERLVGEHPLRERLHAQRMLALYRSGRQAEALDAFTHARRTLVEQIGIEPGAELQRLQQAVLAQAAELDLPAPAATEASTGTAQAAGRAAAGGVGGAPAGPPVPVRARRLVGVLCAGFHRPADPEAAHAALARDGERFAAVVRHHGGRVERLDGEGAIGVFGLDELHEDDALRAVRAATELRAGTAGLGVDAGIVFTGEGGPTGDVLAVAAALQHVAADGELRLGAGAHRLVADAVEAVPAEPVALRGRSSAPSWRLTALRTQTPAPGGLFVGRERELGALMAVVDEARSASACRLVTVVGPPGIGKSRLTRELVARLGDAATVAVGRCPGYGEGRTYRPLAEIFTQLGEPVPAAAARPEETALHVRRRFEALAAARPLVAVVEDVHWAEPTLLDLVEYVTAFSTGAPIVLVCLTRPELLEDRPGWAAPQPGRSLLLLEPLADDEARRMAEAAGAGERTAKIVEAAEGNPLFLEQLLAVQAADGDATLPPSIQAVLAAHIGRLDPGERVVLEHASVVGRSFPVSLVGALLGRPITGDLVALVRRQLIRPDRPDPLGEDAFRFSHALIREAAYAGLPRQVRSEQHQRAAAWLKDRPAAEDELIGHHLEQAHRQRLGSGIGRLAREAAERLEAAAAAALKRGDLPAGAALLERASDLLDPAAAAALAPALGTALLEAGRLGDAERVLAGPAAAGNPRARVELALVRLHADPDAGTDAARAAADEAVVELARRGDDLGQCRAWRLRAWTHWTAGEAAAADAAWRKAAEHAERAGDDRERFEVLGWTASAAAFGPMPVAAAIARCLQIRDEVAVSPVATAVVSRPLALLLALGGHVEQARALIREANATLDELGRMHSAVSHFEAQVELLAGAPDRAEARLRADYERLADMGEQALLATTAAMLAQAVHEQGRADEAAELCAVSERSADPGDHGTQALWRGVRARIAAGRGDLTAAEALAREAVAFVARTDALTDQGDALLALADILDAAGRGTEAKQSRAEALRRYDRKGAAVLVARARSQLGS